MNWYLDVSKKYAVFSGRARRKEYWYFTLFNLIIYTVLAMIDKLAGLQVAGDVGILGSIYSLAALVPSISVSVRRLHDTGRSGWWLLIGLIPILGGLTVLFFMAQDTKSGDNQYGQDPKQISA